MEHFNDIGIGGLDWPRIRKLFRIGLCAALMVLIGDMLLGWGTADENLTGIEKMLSQYAHLSDTRIFLSSLLGVVGIPLEALSYFGVYRLMADRSPRHAHAYRTGIFGYAIFGGCGVHMPCLASVFIYKYMLAASPETALAVSARFGLFFLLPGCALFFLAFVWLCAAQISAFAKGYTPYPKWCWVFSMPVGMVIGLVIELVGSSPLASALSAGWISIGNLWMFGGLLAMMGKAKK